MSQGEYERSETTKRVDERSTLDNLNFMAWAMDVSLQRGIEITYNVPVYKFSPYDIGMSVQANDGSYDYCVEVKGRDRHYENCLIDASKIDKLRRYVGMGINVRLAVLEQFSDRIYMFNLNAIDWDGVPRTVRHCPQTTVATDRRMIDKTVYLIPWTLAKEYHFEGWVKRARNL